MFNAVLVALKDGTPSGPLIDLALNAAAPGAKIHLATLILIGKDEDELTRIRQAEQRLSEKADLLREQGYDASFEVSPAPAAAALGLLRIAREQDVDLMVIGLAKRSRVGKALMGSDAQRILLSASCPVLVKQLFGQ